MDVGGKLRIGDFIGVTGVLSAPAVSEAGSGRIYFDAALGKFRVSEDGGAYEDLVSDGVTALAALTDVDLDTPADEEVLTYQSGSGKWVNLALPPSVTALSALTDVDLDSLVDTEVLSYDSASGKWVNAPSGGIASITVREVDGDPTVTNIQILEFQQGEFTILPMGGGVARMRLTGFVADQAVPPSPNESAAPTLLMTRQNGASPALFRLSAGVLVSGPEGGTTFGTAELVVASVVSLAPCNDAIEFLGKHYVVHSEGTKSHYVYQRQANGSWTLVYDFTMGPASASSAGASRTGLFIASTGSTPVLGFVHIDSTATSGLGGTRSLFFDRTTNGTSWTSSSVVLTTGNNYGHLAKSSCLMHRGSLYIPIVGTNPGGTATHNLHIVNFVTGGISSPIAGTGYGYGPGLCTIYGRVFFLQGHGLFEFTGSSLTQRATLGNGGSSTTIAAGQYLLFADGDEKLVAIYPTSTDGTLGNSYWRAADITFATPIDTVPVVTQKDNLIPTNLRSGGATSNKGNAGFWVFVDNETDSGNPQHYIWWADTAGSLYNYCKYLGSDSALLANSVSVTPATMGLSATREGGGERISPDDTTDVRFDYVTSSAGLSAPGTWNIGWRFVSLNVGATYTAKVFVSATEGTQLSQAVLTGTATGGTRNGNQVEGCASGVACAVDVDLEESGLQVNVAVRLHVKVVLEI